MPTSPDEPRTGERAKERALQTLKATYYERVRDAAQSALAARREDHGDDDEHERVAEAAEPMVTYTLDCLIALLASDNWTAVEDALGERPEDWGAVDCCSLVTAMACHAVERNIRECIEQRHRLP